MIQIIKQILVFKLAVQQQILFHSTVIVVFPILQMQLFCGMDMVLFVFTCIIVLDSIL